MSMSWVGTIHRIKTKDSSLKNKFSECGARGSYALLTVMDRFNIWYSVRCCTKKRHSVASRACWMLQEEVPKRSSKSVLDVGCWMLQDHEDRQEGRRQDVITPPQPPTPPETRTPPNPPPRTPLPPNQRANKRLSRETWRTSQSCAHVGRNVGHRSHPLQRSNHDMERGMYTARTTASIWAPKKKENGHWSTSARHSVAGGTPGLAGHTIYIMTLHARMCCLSQQLRVGWRELVGAHPQTGLFPAARCWWCWHVDRHCEIGIWIAMMVGDDQRPRFGEWVTHWPQIQS